MSSNEIERRGGNEVEAPRPQDPKEQLEEILNRTHGLVAETAQALTHFSGRVGAVEEGLTELQSDAAQTDQKVEALERRLEETAEQFAERERRILASSAKTIAEVHRKNEAKLEEERRDRAAEVLEAKGFALFDAYLDQENKKLGSGQSVEPLQRDPRYQSLIEPMPLDIQETEVAAPEEISTEVAPRTETGLVQGPEQLDGGRLAAFNAALVLADGVDEVRDLVKSSSQKTVTLAKVARVGLANLVSEATGSLPTRGSSVAEFLAKRPKSIDFRTSKQYREEIFYRAAVPVTAIALLGIAAISNNSADPTHNQAAANVRPVRDTSPAADNSEVARNQQIRTAVSLAVKHSAKVRHHEPVKKAAPKKHANGKHR